MVLPSASFPRPLNRVYRAVRSALVSTLRPLQHYHYSLYDLQYLFLLVLFSFCYWIMDKPVWFKLPIASGTLLLLIPRKTRQFMLPFFAIAAWLILFYCCRFIPSDWRPHIFTSVLPALENILYGGSISEMLASSTTPFKDILAWIPYGVLHYVLPIAVALMIVSFGPPGTLPVFARTFGYMNVAGVLTQILFPCAPPWYETRYGGMQPATYTMPGDPGGLARVDDILGVEMYKTTFTASPLVFGAFPSLHSADACQLAFFLVYVFGPRCIPFALGYILWIWWATMYLGHHYVVDLVGGGAYAVIAFWIGSFFLPPVLPKDQDEQWDEDEYDLEYGQFKRTMATPKGGMLDLSEAMHRYEKQTLFSASQDEEDEQRDEDGTEVGSSQGGSDSDRAYEMDRRGTQEDDSDLALKGHHLRFEDHGIVESMEMDDQVIVIVDRPRLHILEIEEARRVRSEPTSPTGSHTSSSSLSSSSASSSTRRSTPSTPSTPSTSRRSKKLSTSYRQSWSGWQGYESWVEVLATVNSPRTSPRGSPKSSPTPSPRSSTNHLPGAPF
ncbi:Aureobasidin resistance protein Aur1 [Mortierella claussenii]|nr:Aureobasidin resistance protein Aur1 [Mortierella claussenii]